MRDTAPIIDCKNISKTFFGVKALQKVNFQLYPGEIHGLVGENGAGKSTLMKIIAGVYTYDISDKDRDAAFLFEGRKMAFKSPADALHEKIMTIHQEINVIPHLTVYENMFLGNEKRKGPWLSRPAMIAECRKLIDEFGADFQATDIVKTLSTDAKKLVEIFRALLQDAKVLMLDEPTSVLTDVEAEKLFGVIKNITAKGIAVVFISHNLSEVMEISDRISVLRDGNMVGHLERDGFSLDRIITLMLGRKMEDEVIERQPSSRETELLRVQNLVYLNVIQDVSLSIYAGEVLGVTGLGGCGATELAKVLFGMEGFTHYRGHIRVRGKTVAFNRPWQAVKNRMALLTEDRKTEGLFLKLKVFENITMSSLRKYLKGIFLIRKARKTACVQYISALDIRVPSVETTTESLSGGNQQKVVISKWLDTEAEIFILDEPTVGIDVGAKREIRKIIHSLASEGRGVMMITSEFADLKRLCDRVIVLYKGRVVKRFENNEELTEDEILKHALGGAG